MTLRPRPAPDGWIATEAVVTSCKFQFARMNTLRFGLQTGEKFRIGFEYYGLAGRYTDEFQSPVAIPQGERIKVSYNPLRPEENSRSSDGIGSIREGRRSLLAIGVGGSIVLSLAWLAMLRGCSSR